MQRPAQSSNRASIQRPAHAASRTSSPSPSASAAGAGPLGTRLGSIPAERLVLLAVVFFGGVSSLGAELAASRLLAPYFGTSLFIWAILIGMELIYLTVGYYVGGNWADKNPSATRLYTIVALAAIFLGLVPLIARPILSLSLRGFASLDFGAFFGALIGTVLLFAIPITLLGMVTPFAIRLDITRTDTAGKTAGQIYALSTMGSILGTFLPVFVFIPSFGTARTFVIFAVVLFLSALAGLYFSGALPGLGRPMGALSVVLLATLVGVNTGGIIKPGYDGKLLTERESLYNYIQVVKNGPTYELILNEGQAIHSKYTPGQTLANGIWDLFLMGPLFNQPPYTTDQFKSAAIIGLGAGTVPKLYTNTYGPIPFDGVEIDPEIVQMGRQYFDMNEKNLNVVVDDGRYFLERTNKKYDLVAIDAYQQPYIPFQLTTREFFTLVRNHLNPKGVMEINAGRAGSDFRLVNALASTISTVYKKVYIIDSLINTNSMIIATNDDQTSIDNLARNAANLTQPDLAYVAQQALDPSANLREGQRTNLVFTDDHAPVEQIINQIILGYVRDESAPQPGK